MSLSSLAVSWQSLVCAQVGCVVSRKEKHLAHDTFSFLWESVGPKRQKSKIAFCIRPLKSIKSTVSTPEM